MDGLKMQVFSLLGNYELQDIFEMMGLLLERDHLLKQAEGKTPNVKINQLISQITAAAKTAETIRDWEPS
jgi:hypothetical protein